MPRFLHLADIHLGFDRYDNQERTKDFFWAFHDVVQKYAIDQQVDFVVIAGDLFEHRTIQPGTLNQAKICLGMLRDAEIPVIAIEGNHDNRPYGIQTSWLRYLSDDNLLILLEPHTSTGSEPLYLPWDGRRGGYIDLNCGVRVLGSYWYGASAPRAVTALCEAIQQLPSPPDHSILLFHHGLEGQVARYQGALRYTDLLPLKQAGIDYLALGHIHKNYEVEGWIFNPGSLEANSIEEGSYQRGAYLVHLGAEGIQADLKRDYRQRPIVRLRLTARGQETSDEVQQSAIAIVQAEIQSGRLLPEQAPIVELRIEGQVGFDRLDLDIRQLQQDLQQLSGALIFLLKYDADRVEYASPIAEDVSRFQVEHEVFTDLLTASSTYRAQAATLAQGLIGLKDLQLQDRPEAELHEFVQTLLAPDEARGLNSESE